MCRPMLFVCSLHQSACERNDEKFRLSVKLQQIGFGLLQWLTFTDIPDPFDVFCCLTPNRTNNFLLFLEKDVNVNKFSVVHSKFYSCEKSYHPTNSKQVLCIFDVVQDAWENKLKTHKNRKLKRKRLTFEFF